MPRFVLARMFLVGLGAVALPSSVLAQPIERVLYVSALDAKTRMPVDTLAPGDLRVTEDGVVREVLRVTPASTPMPHPTPSGSSTALVGSTPTSRRSSRSSSP